ncbi:conjugative transposon protein TraM [Sphingobacterium hotanense]|uniref:conjugative transposon protein TraM n=1 Tax=Sphingobacterium hotanense TaxID=649196 RepID=UPI0021A7EDDC|nr:conjugative transposon protein TraM [Sphingobacterium hotanense]MCT1525830.1 conjugative transposon protein TraM [Sphingobacterium hotanense]
MKINLKQPKYALPLIALPFLCLFFYVYKVSFGKEEIAQEGQDSLQEQIADVSTDVKSKALTDKLEAYRGQYRDGDGYTAIGQIREEQINDYRFEDLYNEQEKLALDSINKALDRKQAEATSETDRREYRYEDKALEEALSSLQPKAQPPQRSDPQADPMTLFRQQMALADSMAKANDPEYQAEMERQRTLEKARLEEESKALLAVSKGTGESKVFNTIRPENDDAFIQAIVDENIKGYAGSRLRIRLLDDITVGSTVVRKGTYLYAEISGFTGQRVRLTITSIFQRGKILPVRLEVYDNDGSPGLYVPASAFREFSRELGSSTTQGVNLQQAAETNNQLVMSVIQRMFSSTTSAVSRQIRKNKAKIKYNTLVYLIDPQELRKSQETY